MRNLAAALLVLLFAVPTAAEDVMSDTAGAAANANNAFGLDLYKRLDAKGNLFFSPYSISSALAMVAEGARGETRTQIDGVFHFPAELSKAEQNLRLAMKPTKVREYDGREMKQVDSFSLNVANATWVQRDYPLEPDFVNVLTDCYDAPPQSIDFEQTAKAREIINDWVEKQTRDRIKDIVPEGLPTPDTRLALANAIHFKANWLHEFKERMTKKEPFRTDDGTEVEVDMMRRVGRYRYAEDADVQVLEMPYKGSDTSMIVVLPKKKDGLSAVESELDWERLKKHIDALKGEQVDVKFPKFEFTQPTDLTALLSDMGMPDAFRPSKADFSGMVKTEPLFIGAVLHKAFVAVDEKGTEAAAATVVMMRAGSAMPAEPPKPKIFVADHPFVFAIRHVTTGAILFMGRMADPSKG